MRVILLQCGYLLKYLPHLHVGKQELHLITLKRHALNSNESST